MAFQPSHTAPPGGLVTRDSPDQARPPGPELEAGLPVEVVGDHGGWAEIRCGNGWTAWVEAERLVPAGVPAEQPASAVVAAPSPLGGKIAVPQSVGARTMLAAGACVALLSFAPWLSFSSGGESRSLTSWKAPALYLIDWEANPDGIKLGVLIVVLGVMTAGLALVRYHAGVARTMGALTLVVVSLYVFQVMSSPGFGIGDVGVGAWLTGIAGLAGLVAARGGPRDRRAPAT